MQSLGKLEQGLTEQKLALEVDPVSFISNSFLAESYSHLRDYGHAIELKKKLVELEPNNDSLHSDLGNYYLLSGDYDHAAEEYEKSLRLEGKDDQAEALRRAYGKGGFRGLLKAQIELWNDPNRTDDYDPYSVAQNYALLNDRENAFLWLNKAYVSGERMLPILIDEQLDNIRPDPRYKAFLRRMGFPPQVISP